MQVTSSRRSLPLQRPTISGERGAAIMEAALTLPILFLFLFGIFGFGLVMSNYQSMVDAAREGARYGAAPVASASYVLPLPAKIAQHACTYLNTGVLGGNAGCSSYASGTTAPPAITSCTDSTFTSAAAAENVYVGVPPSTTPENYTPSGGATLAETQVVVGVRKNVRLPVLGYTVKLRTCSSMRSENN